MGSLFRRKQKVPAIRDILFGDVPISKWPDKKKPPEAEPWRSFVRARDFIKVGENQEAVDVYKKILSMSELESQHLIQVWNFLSALGEEPNQIDHKEIIGIVFEVSLQEGLDLLAAYADGTARYFNYSGAGVVWDAPDSSLKDDIANLFKVGKNIIDMIKPWEGSRPPAPSPGQARINFLTPSGLYLLQDAFGVLESDQQSGPLIAAATELMLCLIAKTKENFP